MPKPLLMDFWVDLKIFSHLLRSKLTLRKCELPGSIKLDKSLFSRTLEGRCLQCDMASGSVSHDNCLGVEERGGGQEGALQRRRASRPEAGSADGASGPLPGRGASQLGALGGLRGLPHVCPLLHGVLQGLGLLLVHLNVVHLLVGSDR